MERTRTGKIGVTRRDGQPYVLPVWFVLDGNDVMFMTGADTVRGRALRREPQASMCVDEERPPYAFVRINGQARLGEDLTEMRLWARRIAAATWARWSPTATRHETRSRVSCWCAWCRTTSSAERGWPTSALISSKGRNQG